MKTLIDWWRWRQVSKLAVKLFALRWQAGDFATPADCLDHAVHLLYGEQDDEDASGG